jgi:hypothetical protein
MEARSKKKKKRMTLVEKWGVFRCGTQREWEGERRR